MTINDNFFKYLSLKIEGFKKTIDKSGRVILICPNLSKHHFKTKNPTATIIANKIVCPICNFKATAEECVRFLEPELKNKSDAEITQHFISLTGENMYKELDEYVKYNWSLVKVAKNGNEAIEKGWTSSHIKDKITWIKWLEAGFNIGARTGEETGITVIDADLKVAPSGEYEKVYRLLTSLNTLRASTPHGKHFVVKYDADLRQSQKLAKTAGITIDIRNDGGQIVVAPSKRDGLSYSWENLGTEIKSVSPELKAKLLELLKVEKVDKKELTSEEKEIIDHPIELVGNNLTGCCNDTFVQFGGALLKMGIPIDKIRPVLFYLNKNWLKNPMPSNAVESMLGSLDGYKQTEEQTQEQTIYDACKLIQIDISAKDIMEHVFPGQKDKRAIVDKYLIKFHTEGKLARSRRGRYDIKSKVEWVDELPEQAERIDYQMPYFDDVAHFCSGDILLLGAPQGHGKTTIAMNIVKQLKTQGIKPYYISLESGSRHTQTAKALELTQKNYYISKTAIDNPLQIEIEPSTTTILDWIYTGEDFSATLSVFKHLNDEMMRRGGILIVFTQLKENYDYFAVNLIKSFPALAARFIYDDESRITSHWQVDKIRDPKGHYSTMIIPTVFDFNTKELKKKE